MYFQEMTRMNMNKTGVSAADSYDPAFGDHVDNLRGTMFYVCQGSCLCGTVNNRGKVRSIFSNIKKLLPFYYLCVFKLSKTTFATTSRYVKRLEVKYEIIQT